MAKCPQCGQKIKPWYVKAECPNCGVNMVNYNWEERLEEDSVRAEEAFRKLHINVAKMKYSFSGTKLRIARIPISVFPLFSFLLFAASIFDRGGLGERGDGEMYFEVKM